MLVVATVHGQHRRNPNYTYEDVVRILDTYDPDLVCVEIRPQDFRREPYLKEMMLATVWGIANGREVCGFDWYEGTARAARARLEEQPEYIEKARVLDSLVATNPIMRSFDDRYGDFWRGEFGYDFYNGREYNRYIEESYRLSLAVYGDSPINLHYELRNRRMMDLAWDVIRQHRGSKVALLTGAEHKHYFDRDLAARENIAVVQLEDFLPLARRPLDPAVAAFLLEDDDLPYYEVGFPADTNRYYWGKLTTLLHGPDMDWRPDIIPAGNIDIAGKVLARWRASQPPSHRMMFDEAWYRFLSDDCDAAVERLNNLAQAVESGAVEDPFVRVYTYRNLGLCYDLLGERQDALRSYARARALMRGTRMERNADLALRDYETVPYRRGSTADR
ncbi:MAG: hypothetical protein GWN99_17685 [Gemmatimonadetes bacterium]|uniref:Tetratricopeptide repeat protein n=1 Tax=Candidatus Kutchimonas denitrificans TaxID=3056748 RepID=A0AAE4Z780_9BACT|nr:hypothetical protein [Gemmatimonadota bacterium]NIR75050.1 hypothetical protein [Candidatus Kutchimonas denitrificans]NIS02870.1 hypothetical protein [Gemmatimonadota bacterium]NIT68575.1 hypothetical protein [Gemmatimonadota bacterium]NIU52820.1 hypothetical protein [Gemmatimonadota bacterium]